MDAHGVQVLDGADNDAVVVLVPHHLHFVFFPADQGLVDQQLVGGGQIQPAVADLLELLPVVGDTAAGTAHGEGRADNAGIAEAVRHLQGFLEAVDDGGPRRAQADGLHGLVEQVPILGLVDGFLGGPDQLHALLGQHAVAVQIQRTVERRLPAHGGQQRIGLFLFDDLGHRLPLHRLDVGGIGHGRVGHDGGRVGVHQDDPVALLLQGLAGLGAGVVELAGLTDHDGAGADDENTLDVGSFGHACVTVS